MAGPQVQAAEHGASGVLAADRDRRRLTSARPTRPQGRQEQQVGFVQGQAHGARERQLENLRDLTEPLVFHYLLLTAYKGRLHRGRTGRDRAARLRAHQERAWWKDEILTYLDAIQDFRRRGNLDEQAVQHVFLEELDPDFFARLHARLKARCHPPFVLALCDACADPHREEGVRLRGFLRSVSQVNDCEAQPCVLSDLQVDAGPYRLWSRYHPSRRPLEMLYQRSGRIIRVTGAIPRITNVPGHKLHW